MVTISGGRVLPLSLPDEDPNWKFAGHAYARNPGVLVELTASDGTRGWGYGAAFPHLGANVEGVMAAAQAMIREVVGVDVLAVGESLRRIDALLTGSNSAKSGVDCAIHDLGAQFLGAPLYMLFGGKVRDSVEVCRMLGLKDAGEMAERAAQRANEGYRCLKLKLSGDVESDVTRTRAVRNAVGDAITLIADANQSYTPKDALAYLAKSEEYDLRLLEQPVAKENPDGLKFVRTHSRIPIEADESVFSVADAFRVVSKHLADSISVKITKLGGLRNAKLVADVCDASGVGCRLGATVGSQLLVAHAIHLAASIRHLNFPCELGEFRKLQNDPFAGLEITEGRVIVPETPGSGVTANQSIGPDLLDSARDVGGIAE